MVGEAGPCELAGQVDQVVAAQPVDAGERELPESGEEVGDPHREQHAAAREAVTDRRVGWRRLPSPAPLPASPHPGIDPESITARTCRQQKREPDDVVTIVTHVTEHVGDDEEETRRHRRDPGGEPGCQSERGGGRGETDDGAERRDRLGAGGNQGSGPAHADRHPDDLGRELCEADDLLDGEARRDDREDDDARQCEVDALIRMEEEARQPRCESAPMPPTTPRACQQRQSDAEPRHREAHRGVVTGERHDEGDRGGGRQREVFPAPRDRARGTHLLEGRPGQSRIRMRSLRGLFMADRAYGNTSSATRRMWRRRGCKRSFMTT